MTSALLPGRAEERQQAPVANPSGIPWAPLGSFPGYPLVGCDVRNCVSLVEPSVLRCGMCRRRHGDHPKATGLPGIGAIANNARKKRRRK